MALDMSKYAKMTKVERKLPIIFMINEKMIDTEDWEGGRFEAAISDIMKNLSHRSVEAVMAVVSFGDEVHLWSGFKEYEKYTEKDWPKTKTAGKSVFNIALELVKDMLEDIDTTPEGNYDPIVVLMSTDEVSPEYKNALNSFVKDGRFKNVQRIGIADLNGFRAYYRSAHYTYEPAQVVNKKAPKVLKEFAGEKVALFIDDDWNTSWCTNSEWYVTETKDDYTWFCPVLEMMELRYTENGQLYTSPVCADEDDDVMSIVRKSGVKGLFGL